MAGILSDIRVLDFGRYVAGPFCAALLADLGADVIRIEPPGGADDRFLMPVTANGEGALYLQCNRGKRSLTLDITTLEGRSVMRSLVATADVVVANAPPRSMEQLGLDYETLKALKADIILASVSAFGSTGPNRNGSGFDSIGQAVSGAMYLTGRPGQPYRSAVSYVDYSTAISAAFGTLAALMARLKTGQGGTVEASLAGTALTMTNPMLIEEASGARSRMPTGNRSPIAGPSDMYPTRDGWVVMQAIGQDMFRRWTELVGRPELTQDEKFATDILRGENGEMLSEIMAAWCGARTTSDCLAELRSARIPAGEMLRPADALLPEKGLADTFLRWSSYPGLDRDIPLVAPPALLSANDVGEALRAPTLGEHTESILLATGVSAGKLDELRRDRII